MGWCTLFQALKAQFERREKNIPATLGLYRYASWLITSTFYLFSPPQVSLSFKLGVVISLLLAGRLSHRLYLGAGENNPALIRILTFVETVGIVLLLLPTGGLGSPFIWYAINPILLAAVSLPPGWCWSVLITFLVGAMATTTIFNSLVRSRGLSLLGNYSYIILIFILVTLGVQLLTRQIKLSEQQARLLDQQRGELLRSWELLSTFYRMIEVLSNHDSIQEMLDLFSNYASLIAGADEVVIYLAAGNDNEQEAKWARVGSCLGETRQPWNDYIRSVWADIRRNPRVVEKIIPPEASGAGRILSLPISSANRLHGLLNLCYRESEKKNEANGYDLSFLADFLAVALERFHVEELNAQLLLIEEQNRIAGEIHDGVAQYLFNISCGCHLLREKWNLLSLQEVSNQLDLLAQTARRAAQELRASIYRLSSRHMGKTVFLDNVNTYIEELAMLNNVRADFEVEGSEEVLSPALRLAFYRIIREASGNAIRHGACRNLWVRLYLAPSQSVLEIEDDGKGWCGQIPNKDGKGLGLLNMQHLMACFNGDLEIETAPGKGTVVRGIVPKRNLAGGTAKEALAGEASNY